MKIKIYKLVETPEQKQARIRKDAKAELKWVRQQIISGNNSQYRLISLYKREEQLLELL